MDEHRITICANEDGTFDVLYPMLPQFKHMGDAEMAAFLLSEEAKKMEALSKKKLFRKQAIEKINNILNEKDNQNG
ncbi:hypothetical protein [Neisseria sp. S1]|uniref:hypothetical protein n=1 Tax=Neisseria sp. S1 TaxID=3318354 RepID=UPI003A891B32